MQQKFSATDDTKDWETKPPHDRKKTVLLLEDEVVFGNLVKQYLESFDFDVVMVKDGVEGMKKVMERDFDIIVCDLLMPNLPGDMFYLGVERVRPHLTQRFIFITGHKGNPRVAEFVKKIRGLTLYKPFDMHLLMDAIKIVEKNLQKAA